MKNKFLLIFSTIVLIIVSSLIIFFIRANRPYARARIEAIEIAEKHADLKETERFYWFVRDTTSFSLFGKNQHGEKIIVVIPQSGEKVNVIAQKDGLSEADAVKTLGAKEAVDQYEKINFGLVDQRLAWEIVTKNEDQTLNYFLIDFKTGEIFNTIKNV